MRLERARTTTIPNGSIFYVLLELKIAVESYKYFAYAVRAA